MDLLVWGANSYGQLGLGLRSELVTEPTFLDSSRLKTLPPLTEIKSISGGGGFTLVLTKGGSVYGCGCNSAGQLLSNETFHLDFIKLKQLEKYKITQLATKWDSCFAITDNDLCIGWGSNMYCQLGHSVENFRCTKEPVVLAYNAVQVDCGARHSAILLRDGTILTSGDKKSGKLGRYGKEDKHSSVPGLENIKSISCGFNHNVALSSEGKLFGWGCNKWGQLGNDPKFCNAIMKPEIFYSAKSNSIISIQCGWSSTHIQTEKGEVINCGRNDYGQLGSLDNEFLKPWNLHTLENIHKISIGSEHAVGLTGDGKLVAWGWNEHGSCGNGNIQNQLIPCDVIIRPSLKVLHVAAASGHNFALVEENKSTLVKKKIDVESV